MSDAQEENTIHPEDIMQMTTDIVASFVGHNTIPAETLPDIIRKVHGAVQELAGAAEEKPAERPKPAVPISKSITPDHLICLEDGKKLKMLKRYLRTKYEMTPDEYRRRWGLSADYPMVAPSYAKRRSDFAKEIGLGRGGRGGRRKK